MASHFKIVDEEHNKELKDKKKSENTMNSTEYWKNILKKWVNERNFQANLEEHKSDVLKPNTVTVLCIQKFSDFALHVIKK